MEIEGQTEIQSHQTDKKTMNETNIYLGYRHIKTYRRLEETGRLTDTLTNSIHTKKERNRLTLRQTIFTDSQDSQAN